ncbi:hypothetical protein GGH99_008803, partial [Coemansia sp. RSA 1285]
DIPQPLECHVRPGGAAGRVASAVHSNDAARAGASANDGAARGDSDTAVWRDGGGAAGADAESAAQQRRPGGQAAVAR